MQRQHPAPPKAQRFNSLQTSQLFSDPGKKREPFLGKTIFFVGQPPKKIGKRMGTTEQLRQVSLWHWLQHHGHGSFASPSKTGAAFSLGVASCTGDPIDCGFSLWLPLRILQKENKENQGSTRHPPEKGILENSPGEWRKNNRYPPERQTQFCGP